MILCAIVDDDDGCCITMESVGYSLLLPSTQPTVCVALFFVLFVSVPTLFCVVVDL